MKSALLFLLINFISFHLFAQTDANMGIIPVPVSIKKSNGSFELDKTVLLVNKDISNAKSADLLNAFIVTKGGFALRESKLNIKGQKAIIFTSIGAEQLPNEGYIIQISSNQIKIIGKDAGLFYAVQSLMQLMPDKKNDKISIQTVEIKDYPRFKYRGMHLDVSRHFFQYRLLRNTLIFWQPIK